MRIRALSVLLFLMPVWLVLGAAASSTTISFSLWGQPAVVESKLIGVTLFKRDYPDVDVEIITAPNLAEYQDKILVMALAGTLPDVMLLSIAYWPDLYQRGFIEPLNHYIETDDDLDWDDYLYRETVMHEGAIVGLPEHEGPMMLAYAEEKFTRAGLATPDALYPRGAAEWNWDTYLDIARKMTIDVDGDGQPEEYGSVNQGGTNLYRLLVQAGGSMFSPDRRTALPNLEAAERAIQFAVDLIELGGAPPVGLNLDTRGISFANGKIGMQNMNAQPFFNAFHTNMFSTSWNIAPHPAGPAGFQNLAIVNPVVVSANSPHKQLAYTLAKYLTGTEAQLGKIAAGLPVAPMRLSVLRSSEFLEANRALNLDLFFEAAVTNIHAYPAPLAGGVQPQNIMTEEFAAALRGEKSAREAAREMKTRIDTLLSGLLNL